mmetsp:Transcript_90685/g.210960  ORF Transcript_90685/g.210960 Transcript_90685/m.210960 type:complete len:298 (-) Transcript_90685:54-947(-)
MAESQDAEGQGQELNRKERQHLKDLARIEELKPLQQKLTSGDPDTQLDGARELRTSLEGAHPPRLDIVLRADIVPRLLELSKDGSRHDLQFEVLWVLQSLTSSTEATTKQVVELGAIDVFEHLLAAPAASCREQALLVLTNIIGTSSELRDAVIKSGVVSDIMKMLHWGEGVEQKTYYDKQEKVWKLRCGEAQQPISVNQLAAKCLAALCSGEPSPVFGEEAVHMLSSLATLLMSTDAEVLLPVCKALSSLKYNPEEHAMLIKDGVDTRLKDLLTNPSEGVQAEAKRAAENVAAHEG